MRESRLKTYAFLAVSGLLAVALVPGARAQEWSGSAEGSTTDGPTIDSVLLSWSAGGGGVAEGGLFSSCLPGAASLVVRR